MHKIVVIEDSSFMRARIVNLLQSSGYTNTEDYAIADDIGRKPQVYLADADLIIADIQLPGISGIDLAVRLKQDPRYADIPIFFVSGFGDQKTINAAVRAGAADYLVKPFDNTIFLDKVKKLLEDQPDIPDAFRCGEEKFVDMLSLEYQRATRGGQYLSVLRLDLRKPDMLKGLTSIRNTVRRIDTLCVFKGTAVLILPLTDEAGVAVVNGKLKKLLADSGLTLLSSDAYTYRGDGELNPDDYIQTILELVQMTGGI
jgi:two-component system phosphate regulon response regulator PhoB